MGKTISYSNNNQMKIANLKIGKKVVRSKGDYVVGRTGIVIAIDSKKNRAQVSWNGETKTWVSIEVIELISIPYTIIPGFYDKKRGKIVNPKYIVK